MSMEMEVKLISTGGKMLAINSCLELLWMLVGDGVDCGFHFLDHTGMMTMICCICTRNIASLVNEWWNFEMD